jgi:hypothetical protein
MSYYFLWKILILKGFEGISQNWNKRLYQTVRETLKMAKLGCKRIIYGVLLD